MYLTSLKCFVFFSIKHKFCMHKRSVSEKRRCFFYVPKTYVFIDCNNLKIFHNMPYSLNPFCEKFNSNYRQSSTFRGFTV